MKYLDQIKNAIYVSIFIIFLTTMFTAIVRLSSIRVRFASLPIYATDGSWAQDFLESSHSRNSSSIYELAEASTLVLRTEVLDQRIEVFGWGGGDPFFMPFFERFFHHSEARWEQFYVYRMKILDVYRDTLGSFHALQQGDVIEVFQYRKLSEEERDGVIYWPTPLTLFDIIPSNINAGDDLIVFLINNHLFLKGFQDIHTDTRFARLRHAREHNDGAVGFRSIVSYNSISGRIRGTPNPNSLFIFTNQVQGAYRYISNIDSFESVNPNNNLPLTRENLKQIKK